MMNKIIYEDLENIKNREIPWKKLRNKTVLITGAYGMCASYVTYMLIHLNEEYQFGIQIIALVRSREKAEQRFGEYIARDYFVLRTDSLDDPLTIDENIDFIINSASFASPQYYSVCPVDVAKPNVIGTYHLLELVREKKVEGFLMFSTGDIYGVVMDGDAVTEESMGVVDPLDIHSCYSESKRMAETLCKCYQQQYSVPVKIARIWHTYSPTMDIENDPRVFSSFVKNVVNCEDIVMKSAGTQKRTFCYIADAVAGFFIILLSGVSGEAYNVCNTEQFVSIGELARTIVGLRPEYNLSVKRQKRDPSESYTENSAIGALVPSNQKLKELGWEPKFTIENGFDRVIKFFEC